MFSQRSSQEVRRLIVIKSFVDFDFLIIKQIPLIRDVTHVFPETLPELSMSPTPPVWAISEEPVNRDHDR